MPSMIFHCPFPLNPDSNAASGIRPVQMFQAFENLGYDVFQLTGFGKERSVRFKELQKRIQTGERFDFMYSESSTKPLSLTEPNNLPRYPVLDYRILRFAQQQSIPVGLFYRDVYWRFPNYLKSVNRALGEIARVFYRLDLRMYRKYLHTLFLPSLVMQREIPEIPVNQTRALPPASKIVDSTVPTDGLSLFWVGSVGPYSQIHEAIRAVVATPGVSMIICTPPSQWESVKHEYVDLMDDSIRIVHGQGDELKQYFDQSHIGMLFVKPLPYREFASPFKFFEYLGHGKPIIASEQTFSAEQVSEDNLGWSIPYQAEALQELLQQLVEDPDLVQDKIDHVRAVAVENTWEARAQQAADWLMKSPK